MLGLRDRARVRLQLRRVSKRLAARRVGHLTQSQQAGRREALRELDHYRRWKRLPRNTYVLGRRPVFVDERGSHCAVAHLMASSAAAGVVAGIRRAQNLASVPELQSAALLAWSTDHGLTAEELAEIQPEYAYRPETDWTMTWMIAGFAGAALIALALAVGNFLRRLAGPWLRWVAVLLGLAGTAIVTWIYHSRTSEPAACLPFFCVDREAANFVQPVMIALWVASGLLVALALQGWRQRRRPPLIGERYRRPPFP